LIVLAVLGHALLAERSMQNDARFPELSVRPRKPVELLTGRTLAGDAPCGKLEQSIRALRSTTAALLDVSTRPDLEFGAEENAVVDEMAAHITFANTPGAASIRGILGILGSLGEHRLANVIDVVGDGVEALDYLHRRDRCDGRPCCDPVLVLPDLKMPPRDGLEVLRQIKSDPQLKSIPVVVMTSSHEEQDILSSQQLGAVAYVLKPVRLAEFLDSIAQLGIEFALTTPDELESSDISR